MIRPLRPATAFNRSPSIYHVVFSSAIRAPPPIRHVRLFQTAAAAVPTDHQPVAPPQVVSSQPLTPPLALLPFKDLVRSYLINAVSSSSFLLNPSLGILSLLAYSESPFLNPDHNPILRSLLRKTFYAQFCGGETRSEIQKTVNELKRIGFAGVILAYAREIVVHDGPDLSNCEVLDSGAIKADVESWKNGNLETIDLTSSGEFVGLKFTGAGKHAVRLLAAEQPPSAMIDEALKEICDCARAKNVRLLFDAEQNAIQRGIDAWTILFQRKYNKDPRTATVYGTYQAYLRSTPATIAEHLESAGREGFRLGVKLVRGAYLTSDDRHLFWADKDETDRTYDGIAEALITRKYNKVLKPNDQSGGRVPKVDMVLATHNRGTVKKAMSLRKQQAMSGEERIDLVYGQLMGMADEVSCELVQASKSSTALETTDSYIQGPKAFKYLVWGSVGDCTKYLLRRAEENRDAVLRAAESRVALGTELRRRIWVALGFGKLMQ